MSTKIYNGYIIKGHSGLNGLTNFCQKVKNTIAPIREKLIHELIITMLCRIYDYNNNNLRIPYEFKSKNGENLLEKKELINPYMEIIDYIEDMQKEIIIKGIRNPLYDFGFELCFIPVKNKILCLKYAENNEFTKAWEQIEGVEDYYYQDQSDPPPVNVITTRQWNQRRKDWEVISHCAPCEIGLSFDPFKSISYSIFSTAYDNTENILSLQPTINERASNIASEFLFKEYEENISKNKSTLNKNSNEKPLKYWDIYKDYLKFKDTDEGKNKEKHLIEKLSKNISIITKNEMFLKKIKINYIIKS